MKLTIRRVENARLTCPPEGGYIPPSGQCES
jgi:hypothetical protein